MEFWCLRIVLVIVGALSGIGAFEHAKYNGNIYVYQKKFPLEGNMTTTTASGPNEFEAAITYCNETFITPMSALNTFNTTGELPDIVDKTGICFVRCLFENSHLIDNWKLDDDRVRDYIWPATGETIEYCQKEGIEEDNPCVRTYAIAKCLMINAIVDARNIPII